MDVRPLTDALSVGAQLLTADLPTVKGLGFRSIVCNRPDGEAADQPSAEDIARAAQALGMACHHLPIQPGQFRQGHASAFDALVADLPKPVLAYCRTGARSATLWALSQVGQRPMQEIIGITTRAGFDVQAALQPMAHGSKGPAERTRAEHEVVIVGGGAAGIAVASSLLTRQPGLDIAIIDPAEVHHYQPGWTMVGAGVFSPGTTARAMASVLPRGVHWIPAAVATFEPERNAVVLDDGQQVRYRQLVVCPGLTLDWQAIDGLAESLGHHGVTSNYRHDLAPYTWRLVQEMAQRKGGGRAVFSQPPMPIKCAGAPQKAMYLSADHWRRQGALAGIDIQFCSAGAVLFGVADYVPALMEYVKAYGIGLNFGQTLVSVDGPAKTAVFQQTRPDGSQERITRAFDLLHAVPPQKAPDFIRSSPLADAAGWVDIDPGTLRHPRFNNVFGLGDATNSPNAKTAAAARKQAPVVAHNLMATRAAGNGEARGLARYDGYGSCPLTVERGKIVLAEFTYGGKLAPSFPRWLIDGTRPSALAWLLKERLLPPLYWDGMLKGREWLAQPAVAG